MNSATIRKLAPFSVGRRLAIRPSNRNLEGRFRFSPGFKPRSDIGIRKTPDPIENVRERNLGSRLGLQALSLVLALLATDCDHAQQKEIESQPRIPSPSVNEPDFISPTLREAVEKQVGTYQLRSQYVLDEALKGKKEAVLNVVREYGLLLRLAAPSLQKQKDVVLVAVEQNFSAFQYADPLLRNDGEYVLTLMAIDPRVVGYADESLRENRDFILKAVKIYGLALQIADNALKSEKEVVLAAVNQNGEAIQFAGPLSNDVDILFAATRQLGRLIPGKTSQYLRALNVQYVHAMNSSIYANSAQWDTVIAEVILNRVLLRSDGRPVATIIYPKGDHNGNFRPGINGDDPSHRHIQLLMAQGYRVHYYESRTESELFDAIKESSSAQKISVLIIAGHSDFGRINLGGTASNRGEIYYLGINDMAEMRELSGYIAEEGVIIIDACSAGVGRNNIAQVIARTFPGRKIFAPNRDNAGFGMRFDDNNEISEVLFCYASKYPDGSLDTFSCEERFTAIFSR